MVRYVWFVNRRHSLSFEIQPSKGDETIKRTGTFVEHHCTISLHFVASKSIDQPHLLSILHFAIGRLSLTNGRQLQ